MAITANAGASETTGATPTKETSLEKNLPLLLAWKVQLLLRTKRSLCNLNTLLMGSDGQWRRFWWTFSWLLLR
jgi:hypothetical protein